MSAFFAYFIVLGSHSQARPGVYASNAPNQSPQEFEMQTLGSSTCQNEKSNLGDTNHIRKSNSVISILLFQTFIAVAFVRWTNLRSKAQWRDLRHRGIAILDGPSLIWKDTIPPAPTVSTYNLRQKLQRSDE
ncbi:hypothetical protein G6011_07413 [Alternaria panax]|uniref:Uncharacterized protein n=1 Tax=Alternaria panax TaxID=48097 RepID=A0AAD4FEW6_9PLEO|nr:hypothetical protein G6011_07413 [Alternaria panax]